MKKEKKMEKRKYIDWDSVEPLFKENIMTNCEICRQYEADHLNSQVWNRSVSESAIRKKSLEEGWEKNLADKVKKQIQENLVRDSVRSSHQTDNGMSDNDIISHAAGSGARIIVRHRKEILELLEHENMLLAELKDKPTRTQTTIYQGKFKSKEIALTVFEKSTTLKNLAAVRAQRVALERQAHNLNESEDGSEKSIKVGRHSADEL